MLKNNGLVGSMGRVASAGDNAAMESFFALLQKNVLDTKRWQTREEHPLIANLSPVQRAAEQVRTRARRQLERVLS